MKIEPRNFKQLEKMRLSGLVSAKALKAVIEAVSEGKTLEDLDKIAFSVIKSCGAKPSFMTVPGYKWTSCINLNDEVVHGIPRPIKIKRGDLVSIDLGAIIDGWHTDCAWTVCVGDSSTEVKRFLKAGEEAMWAGIGVAIDGNQVGDIGYAMSQVIERAGFSVVKSLVGHGVGRQLHEPPEIPGYGIPKTGFRLKKGMTIAIEAIYTSGNGQVVLDQDGWTVRSQDGSLGGLFEMSLVVGQTSPEVLTDWRRV